MNVSYYNYARMNDFIRKDIRNELEYLLSLDSDQELFAYQSKNEKRIGKLLGKGHAVGTSSGTAALQFALTTLSIGKGDEVITVPNTYIGTLLAISASGAKPVFVDIKKSTMLIDIDQIEERVTDNTKAIMPIHLYGQMTDMDKIRRIAKKYKLHVIEDACHAHLARYNNRLPGSISDAACYSFFPSKCLGGIANGGMVITRNWSTKKRIEILRNPTSNNSLVLSSRRTPAYLDWMQIAFLKCRVKYLKEWTEKRRTLAATYLEELHDLPLKLPSTDKKAYHVYRDFVIRTDKRNSLKRYLSKKKIETAIHYDRPIHLTKPYENMGYSKGDFPVSEQACSQVLSLPLNPFLTEVEVQHVAQTIRKYYRWT